MHPQSTTTRGWRHTYEEVRPFIDAGSPDACWGWRGRHNSDGYAVVGHGTYFVYHIAYEHFRGDIPEGLQPDHLCRVRGCVNPFHLELVTLRENVLRGKGAPARNARKTHCKWGHPFDDVNTFIDPKGHRQCRTCARKRGREWMRAHSKKALHG